MKTLIGRQDDFGRVRLSTCDLTYEPEIFWPNYLKNYGVDRFYDVMKLAGLGHIAKFDDDNSPFSFGSFAWREFEEATAAIRFFERYNAEEPLSRTFRWFYLYRSPARSWFVYDFESPDAGWTNLDDKMFLAKKYRVTIRETVEREVEVWSESALNAEEIVERRYKENDDLPWRKRSEADVYIQTFGYDKTFDSPTGESTNETSIFGY